MITAMYLQCHLLRVCWKRTKKDFVKKNIWGSTDKTKSKTQISKHQRKSAQKAMIILGKVKNNPIMIISENTWKGDGQKLGNKKQTQVKKADSTAISHNVVLRQNCDATMKHNKEHSRVLSYCYYGDENMGTWSRSSMLRFLEVQCTFVLVVTSCGISTALSYHRTYSSLIATL